MLQRFFLAALLTLALPAMAWADSGPKAVVQQTVDRVIQILKERANTDVLSAKDRLAIKRAVKTSFDFREMAKRSLSKGWKKINEKQRARFVYVFSELLERSYGNRLAGYSGQTVSYGEVSLRNNKATVDTEIVDEHRRIPVQYKLHRASKSWRVYDIKIEGLSLVSTFRSDFKRIMKKKGFKGLMKTLSNKLKRLRDEEKAQS